MNYGRLSLITLAAVFAFGIFLTGCGGQSGGESKSDSPGKTQAEKGGQTGVATKITIGRVTTADPDGRRFVMRANVGSEEEQRMVFVVAKKAKITLDGQEATLDEAKKGQQAQVKYFVKKDRNRAVEIVLFEKAGAASGSGETGTTN